jgi:hypothetical protein
MRTLILFVSILSFLNASAGDLNGKRSFLDESHKKDTILVPKNVVKMNLSSLALITLSFQAEHAFNKRMSGCVGFYRITPLNVPDWWGMDDHFTAKFNGWGITPEFRYFPGKKKAAAPNGFYLAPYFRFTRYTLNGTYSDAKNGVRGNLRGVSTAYGPGIMIGSQWIIGKHFSIDLFIAGIHGGVRKYKIDVQDPAIAAMNLQEQEDAINGMLGVLSKYVDVEAELHGDVISTKFASQYWGVRGLGFNLGFAF